MQIVLSGLLISTGFIMIGLAFHNTIVDAWDVLIGKV
jgi:hypothetical protein